MATIRPNDLSVPKFHGLLLNTIAPRPIAFASTVDENGSVNLSPFSFFNVFSANPPIMIFSPARRARDNTTKHTLENVLEVPEVCISVVSYSIVEQMSLSSTEFGKGVDEFEKSGLTKVKSEFIKPPRVAESPVSYECKVVEVKHLGSDGGAGNLIISEVLAVHISDDVIAEDLKVDYRKLDLVGRMGGNLYSRTVGDSVFEVAKPLSSIGVGADQIPREIRFSNWLTGNHIGKLGNIEKIPSQDEVQAFSKEPEVSSILDALDGDPDRKTEELHKLASFFLDQGDIEGAWKVLLQD